jgi:hypothetical protein
VKENEIIDGRYRVIRPVGEGAFGRVYHVVDPHHGTHSALKVLNAEGPVAEERLRQEYGVLAQLDHPAFSKVRGVGKSTDGYLYLVTEWVSGTPLDELMKADNVGVNDAIALASALALGLGYLHDRGFVHRDIKPSNVMVPDNPPAFGRAKLLDFGVVGQLFQEGNERITSTGMMVGTPRYMSPEQISALPQSPATDVYGLGLLLFEMLYKRLPHGDEDSVMGTMVRIMHSDAEIPGDVRVPRHIRSLLAQALQRDPDRRPSSAYEFANRLTDEPRRKAAGPVAPRPAATPLQVRPKRASRVAERRQLEAPRPLRRRSAGIIGVVFGASTVFVVALMLVGVPDIGTNPGQMIVVERPSLWPLAWIALGLALAAGGILIGNVVRRVARARLHQVEIDAERLLLGLKTKKSLTDTIQVEVEAIIATCRDMDERLLGVTILRMIGEYDAASKSDERQSALMNVAALLEKLRGRLSPWYARFEKQLALTTSTIGVVSGIVSVVAGIVKMMNGTK